MTSQFTSLVQLRVEPELRQAINASALKDRTSAAEWVRRALRKAVGKAEPVPVMDALARAREGRPTQEDLDTLVAAIHRAPGAIEALEVYRENVCQEMIHANEALVQAMFIVATGGNPERLVGFMAQVDDHLTRAGAGIKGMGAFGLIAVGSEA